MIRQKAHWCQTRIQALYIKGLISPSHEHLDEDNGYVAWFCEKQRQRPRADAYCLIRKSDPTGQEGGKRSEAGKAGMQSSRPPPGAVE